jgi:hypothetical protein
LLDSVTPGASPALPAGFAEAHGKETAAIDDRTKFATKQQYVDLLEKQRVASKAALSKLPDSEMGKPAPKEMQSYCPTVGAIFMLMGGHLLMHSGQFATVRRLLGKPVLI